MNELQAKGPVWKKRQFWSIYRIAASKEKSPEKNHVLIVTGYFTPCRQNLLTKEIQEALLAGRLI